MKDRGELPPIETRRRLSSAIKEISTALKYDFFYFMINDTYKHAAAHIDGIVTDGARDEKAEKLARASAEQLLEDTKQHLASLG